MAEVTVSLPDELITLIDQAARAEQRTRAELLHEAIEQYLRETGRLHRWEDPTVLHALAVQDRIAREGQDDGWAPVVEIRRMRESRR